MAIDMSQFYQVFFEETGEHLATMENLLLTLDVGNPDPEQLNAIFRAAHSIKGSSGTFGFSDLADVTHILENLLDRIRKGELKLREDMIDAFLDAGDILKSLLAAHKGEGAADPGATANICARLHELTENAAAQRAAPATVPSAVPVEAGAANGQELYFVLDGDVAAHDRTVEILLDELAAQGGACVVARPQAYDQPWHLHLTGSVDPDQVRGMLEFVARNDSIRIVPAGEGAATALADSPDGAYGFFDTPTSGQAVAAEDDAYGFFEPLPAVPATGAAEEAYGFFEPLSAPTQEAKASAPGSTETA
ncbi:MAG: Hpt domain-containing protein [Pseudomonadota bacterium]